MINYELESRLSRIERFISSLSKVIEELKKEQDKSQDLWTEKDLCRYWQISARTAANLRANKKIDFCKIGGKVFYTKQMRENYIENNSIINIYEKKKKH